MLAGRRLIIPALAMCALLVAGCATQKAVTLGEAPARNRIKAESAGFSPTGEASAKTMKFALSFGAPAIQQHWTVQIVRSSIVVKQFDGQGSGSDLPAELEWDGLTSDGAPWPEGRYLAVLHVDYSASYYSDAVELDGFSLSQFASEGGNDGDSSGLYARGRRNGRPRHDRYRGQARYSQDRVVVDRGRRLPGQHGQALFRGGGSVGGRMDGSLDPAGLAEPSKSYVARAEVIDEYGNRGASTAVISVREQGAATEASLIETEVKGFSPAASGGNGTIDFSMRFGNPDSVRSWNVDIVGGGVARRSFSGRGDSLPTSLVWDGKDDAGTLAPEGSYYAMLSIDYGRTFKAAQARTKDFVLSASAPDCKLTANPDSFTPSDKGVAAPIAILLDATSRLARVTSWTLDILDPQGRNIKSVSQDWPANQVIWDGQVSPSAIVETGATYLARATVHDEFGAATVATLSVKVKDIPPPTELSVIEPRLTGFSPVAEGKLDSIDFIMVAGNMDQMKSWKVTISHSERGAQRVITGAPSAFKRSLSWDGRTDSGTLAPDGTYYVILSIDYGRSYSAAAIRSTAFSLQSTPPDVALEVDPPGLVPKGGSFESPVDIRLAAHSRFAAIESWAIRVMDAAGNTVALFNDTTPGGTARWDGRTLAGGLAEPSATYLVVAEVKDSYGNKATTKAQIPVADLPPVPGQCSITPSAPGFSPDAEGAAKTIDLGLAVPNMEAVKSWKVGILGSSGDLVKSYSGDASALKDALTWAGRSDSGTVAPEDSYTARLDVDYGAIYKAATATSRKFVLETSPPKATISVSPAEVVPDEKGLVAPAGLDFDGTSALGRMASWQVEVVDSTGKNFGVYKGAWPGGRIAWEGIGGDGSFASPETSYFAILTATDEFGLSTQAKATIKVLSLPAATEPSSVTATAQGFSPRVKGTMGFTLQFGNSNLIKSWKLDIERDDRTVRLSFPGTGDTLPPSFNWNGSLQDGTIAPDGRYTAILHIDYGRVYAEAAVESEPFSLVATPPAGKLSISPDLFSPDGGGSSDTVTIALQADSRWAKINDWSVDILDPGGNPFASFKGDWPAKAIAWNGRNGKNELVESAEDYPVIAHVRDEFGNALELKSAVQVDILIVKMGDGYRIRIASIVFKPFTADYLDVAPDIAGRNVATLNLLAEKLKKFPGYQIKMVGHAVMVNWDNPVLGKAEQDKELIPLSKARAEAIMQALVARGIEASRIVTSGVGASDQIVPDSDYANRWKNRRVEFYLRK